MTPKYAISANGEGVLAQHGNAKLLRYDSDYYGNFVEIAEGSFQEMSDLAKKLNASDPPEHGLTLMANPTMPTDEQLREWFDLAEETAAVEDGTLGLRAIWRNGDPMDDNLNIDGGEAE
jgi:hypothetical protein